MKDKLKDLNKSKLKYLYHKKKFNLQNIANIYGVSKQAVWKKMNKLNINTRSLSESMSLVMKGENNPRYIKNEEVLRDGYIWIRKSNHPKNNGGRIKRARWVMEKYLGRYLKKDENIHHMNGIKTDDNINNLMLVSRSEHMKIHRKK